MDLSIKQLVLLSQVSWVKEKKIFSALHSGESTLMWDAIPQYRIKSRRLEKLRIGQERRKRNTSRT